MSLQSEKGGSATKPPDQILPDMELKLTQLIDELKTSHENTNSQSIMDLLRELKKKYINSKPIVRFLRESHGLEFLVTMWLAYTKEYVTQPSQERSQLTSLLVGILGNCCIMSNSVQSAILSKDTLECLMSILSTGELDTSGKLWPDTVKLLFVLKPHRPDHIELLCELGVVEIVLKAFEREDKKSISSVIKLLTGLTHSPMICIRMIDTSGIKLLIEYVHSVEEDSTVIEVLKVFTNILHHRQEILAYNFNSHGGVYKVIELCQNKNKSIKSVAWDCFLECNYCSETRASIGNAGGIQLLLKKLNSYAPNEIPHHLFDILSDCSKDPSNRQHIKSSNALQFVINVIKQVKSEKALSLLLNTVTAFYFDEESFVFMVKRLNLVETLTHVLHNINEAFKSEDRDFCSGETRVCPQLSELSFLSADSFVQSAASSGTKEGACSLISCLENQVLTLLSKTSHTRSCLLYLAASEVFGALILYILTSNNPHSKSAKILNRISQDNACFEKLLRDGNIPLLYELCIHAENLPPGSVGLSKLDIPSCPVYVPTQEYNLLDNVARAAETPFGMGVINSMLKGSVSERTTCVLSLPYLCRTKKKRFFHDCSGTVTSLIEILSSPIDEDQFHQAIKAFSYFCESLQKPTPPDLPYRLCQSPTSPLSRSPSSYSPPHEYNPAYMFSIPGPTARFLEDSSSELSSGALSEDDYSFDSSVKRQSKLNRAIRPEMGSIEYCPPAKRPHLDTDNSTIDVTQQATNNEHNDNVNNCFYAKYVEQDFDFIFCVEERLFSVNSAVIAASSEVLGAMIRWARSTSSGDRATLTLVPAFIFESIIHQIYNCSFSCPIISGILWPENQENNTDYQHPNEIQQKHINFLTAHANSLSSSMNTLLNEVFQATQDQSSIFPGYHDPSSKSSSNRFTKFLHLLALFFSTDILIMDYKAKVTTSLGPHITHNNAVVLLVLSIEFHWSLLANKICRYIYKEMETPLRRNCFQKIMKYPESVTDEILELFHQMIMESVLK